VNSAAGLAAGMSRAALVNKWVRGEHSLHGRAPPIPTAPVASAMEAATPPAPPTLAVPLADSIEPRHRPRCRCWTCRRLVSVARRFGPTSCGACRSADRWW